MNSFGKFKFSLAGLLFFCLIGLSGLATQIAISQSPEMTATGFYWPTGTSDYKHDGFAGWLADGCTWSNHPHGNYFGPDSLGTNPFGSYHIGWDIMANLNAPVYAIADGTVVTISPSGWWNDEEGKKDGNIGVIVRHQLSDKKEFLAVYGHITSTVQAGDPVTAGHAFAKVSHWNGGDHLHFGISPGASFVDGNHLGIMPCLAESPKDGIDGASKNGFEDPIKWITTRTPLNSLTPSPAPASSANLSWLKTSYTINIAFPWHYTFGFCNDSRPIKLFLDNNLVIDKGQKVPSSSATVGLWSGDHAVRTEVLDSIHGTSPDLQMVAWPASVDCKGKVLGASTAATVPTIAPVETVQSPSTIVAVNSSILGIPTLVGPPNGSLVSYTTAISLQWQPVVGATTYRVEFLGDQSPTSLPCGANGNIICSFKDVQPGTLSWHVKAIRPNGNESDWSETWSFTIQLPPLTSTNNVPALPGLPSLSVSGQGTSVTLNWTYDAAQPDGYKIYVDGQLYETINSPTTTSYSHSFPCGHLYTFYVTAYNPSGESSRSNTSQSYTGDCVTPTAEALTWAQPDLIALTNSEYVLWYAGVDTKGTVHIVWEGWDYSSYGPIMYAQKNLNQAWSEPEKARDAPSNFAAAFGLDGSTSLLIESPTSSGSPLWVIDQMNRSPQGEWDSEKEVSGSYGSLPGISVDSSGTVYGVWSCNSQSNDSVCIGIRPVGKSWVISKIPGVGIYISNIQQIAADPAGNIHAIIYGTYNGPEGLYDISQTASGDQSVTRIPDACSYSSFVSDSTGTLHLADPKFGYCTKPMNGSWSGSLQIAPGFAVSSVAIDGKGNVYAAGVQDVSGGKQAAFTWRNVSSTTWAPLTTIESMPLNSGPPTILVTPNGKVHIVWSFKQGGEWRLFHSYLQ